MALSTSIWKASFSFNGWWQEYRAGRGIRVFNIFLFSKSLTCVSKFNFAEIIRSSAAAILLASLGTDAAVWSKWGGNPPQKTICMCRDPLACSSVAPNDANGIPISPWGRRRKGIVLCILSWGGVPNKTVNTASASFWYTSAAATGFEAKNPLRVLELILMLWKVGLFPRMASVKPSSFAGNSVLSDEGNANRRFIVLR